MGKAGPQVSARFSLLTLTMLRERFSSASRKHQVQQNPVERMIPAGPQELTGEETGSG